MKLTQPPFFRNQFIVGLLPFGTLTVSKDLRYNHFGWSAPKLSIENKEFVNWIWYLNFGKVCNYVWSSLIWKSFPFWQFFKQDNNFKSIKLRKIDVRFLNCSFDRNFWESILFAICWVVWLRHFILTFPNPVLKCFQLIMTCHDAAAVEVVSRAI